MDKYASLQSNTPFVVKPANQELDSDIVLCGKAIIRLRDGSKFAVSVTVVATT